jgi:adenosylhomocysteine nucleosidase/5'-methylthioadenosine nucleosidase
VASGNDLETHPRDLEFFDRHGVVAKEMEAASVAWVGGLLGVPVHALKAITDFVDHPASTAAQFESNFQAACAALTVAVSRAADWLLSSRPAAP